MSRKKSETLLSREEIDAELGLDEIKKPVEIKGAKLKDDYCTYSYELMEGACEGDILSRKGTNIIHDDMKEAFEKLHVHLAIADDVFKYSKIEISNLDEFHNHELTELFNVSEFEIKGNVDNRSVILKGTKFISQGGYIPVEPPRIKFEGTYPFKDELYAAIELCCHEVEEYMNGKAAPVYEQTEMEFDTNVSDKEFSEAAL